MSEQAATSDSTVGRADHQQSDHPHTAAWASHGGHLVTDSPLMAPRPDRAAGDNEFADDPVSRVIRRIAAGPAPSRLPRQRTGDESDAAESAENLTERAGFESDQR